MRTWDNTNRIDMVDTVPCDVCGEPVHLEDAHNPHDPDCPATNAIRVGCTCDRWVHPDCCQECRELES